MYPSRGNMFASARQGGKLFATGYMLVFLYWGKIAFCHLCLFEVYDHCGPSLYAGMKWNIYYYSFSSSMSFIFC